MTLDAFPAELKLHFLKYYNDFLSLAMLIRASPRYLQIFLANRHSVLETVARRHLDDRVNDSAVIKARLTYWQCCNLYWVPQELMRIKHSKGEAAEEKRQ